MAPTQNQQERRADTVAISRATVKIATWLASISFMGVSTFIWGLDTKVHELTTTKNILELRVATLENFARTGNRFTESDGKALARRIEKVEGLCNRHRDLQAHREQKQLNRELIWRIEKLERPNSDNGRVVHP